MCRPYSGALSDCANRISLCNVILFPNTVRTSSFTITIIKKTKLARFCFNHEEHRCRWGRVCCLNRITISLHLLNTLWPNQWTIMRCSYNLEFLLQGKILGVNFLTPLCLAISLPSLILGTHSAGSRLMVVQVNLANPIICHSFGPTINLEKLRSREMKWIHMMDNWRYFMDEKWVFFSLLIITEMLLLLDFLSRSDRV